jgi:hypothetical protein
MQLLKNYLNHFRFTFGEFRTNVRRLGIGVAFRFFLMRSFLPFGRPRRYFLRRHSDSPVINSIDRSGYAELQRIEPAMVQRVLDQLLTSVSNKLSEPVRSIDEYADALRGSNVQRQTGLISDGSLDCPLAALARSSAFSRLASEYLEMEGKDLVVEATVDTLVSGSSSRAPNGYDNALEFHRDIDAYRFFKIFVYLTDCFEGDGHHEIYLASHRHYPLQLVPIKRYHAHEIEKLIPESILKKVTGPAGYAFGENTVAFHRGTSPMRGYRIILNLIYTEATFKGYYFNAFPVSTKGCE